MPKLRTIDNTELEQYAAIPIAFMVQTVLVPSLPDGGMRGIELRELPIPVPYLKDYDAYGNPTGWPMQFDTSGWHMTLACQDNQAIGAATVAVNAVDSQVLRGRADTACLWDLRVAPDWRGRGVGTLLFQNAAMWSAAQGYRLLAVETQNINVPACHFYRKMGCQLGTVDRYFYRGSDCEDEICLIWYLALTPAH